MAVALDSNAVIGFLDRTDEFHTSAKQSITRLLGEGEYLTISVVTYAEVMTGVELAHPSREIATGFFRDLISEIRPVGIPDADRAAELRGAVRSLKMPDALILASADLDPDVSLVVCADDVAKRARKHLDCSVEGLSSS